MMNSLIKPCMPGLFSNEHLALQFLVAQTICKSVVSQLNVIFLINQFCSLLIFIFSIFWTLNYPDYFVCSHRVQIIEVQMYKFKPRVIQTPHSYGQFAFSLQGKETPSIFSKFKLLKMDTPLLWALSMAPSVSFLTRFHCITID